MFHGQCYIYPLSNSCLLAGMFSSSYVAARRKMSEHSVPRYKAHEVSATWVGGLDANPACQVLIIVESHFVVMRRGGARYMVEIRVCILGVLSLWLSAKRVLPPHRLRQSLDLKVLKML